MKFTFKAVDTDDSNQEITREVNFETDVWTDTFPLYLDFLRGCGFVIGNDVAMYRPGKLAEEFGRARHPYTDAFIYDSDLEGSEYSGKGCKNCDC